MLSDADAEAVRAAYRAEMMRHHPDTNRSPDSTGRAARINEAWACLRDPDRRRAYDEALEALAEVRAAVPRHRPFQPHPSYTPPAAPANPLNAAVFLIAAVIAVIPTMLLVALSHGWGGSSVPAPRLAAHASVPQAPAARSARVPSSTRGLKPPDVRPKPPLAR